MTGVVGDGAAVVERVGAGESRADADARRAGRWAGRPTVRGVDAVLAVAIVVAAALRLWGLGRQSFWYDEWLTARAADGSAGDLLRYVANQAGIPPTYFAIMWGWARVFGESELALRSVSALAGIATVPVAYVAARELRLRPIVARVAAIMVAVNPMLVWYSQDARPYSIVALLGALSLWALARVWTRGEPRDVAVWAFVCAVTVSFHYFSVFFVAAEAVAVLVRTRPWERRPTRRDLFATFWPAGVVLLLLAPFAIRQFSRRGNHDWISDVSLATRLSEAGRSALVGPSYPSGRLWMAAAAIAALAIPLVVLRGDRRERRVAGTAGALGLASVVLALAAGVVGVDVVLGRYLIVALVPLAVAVAVGLSAVRVPRWITVAAVAALCGISVATVAAVARDPLLQRADWDAVAAAHDAGGESGEARLLVLNNHDVLVQPLEWYLADAEVLGRREGVVVEEIDIVYARPPTEPCNFMVGMACSLYWLGTLPPEPVLGQLVLEERIDLDQFFVERYRLRRPVRVTPGDVVPASFLRNSLVFVTGASGSSD